MVCDCCVDFENFHKMQLREREDKPVPRDRGREKLRENYREREVDYRKDSWKGMLPEAVNCCGDTMKTIKLSEFTGTVHEVAFLQEEEPAQRLKERFAAAAPPAAPREAQGAALPLAILALVLIFALMLAGLCFMHRENENLRAALYAASVLAAANPPALT